MRFIRKRAVRRRKDFFPATDRTEVLAPAIGIISLPRRNRAQRDKAQILGAEFFQLRCLSETTNVLFFKHLLALFVVAVLHRHLLSNAVPLLLTSVQLAERERQES